jgi:archaellum component FlaC
MKNKPKKKKITMEDLAGMVQRGFSSVDKQFAETAKKSELEAVKKEVVDLREDFNKILTSLDKVAKQYSDYLEERKMRDAEISRLKRWVEQIAQKVGVQLD